MSTDQGSPRSPSSLPLLWWIVFVYMIALYVALACTQDLLLWVLNR